MILISPLTGFGQRIAAKTQATSSPIITKVSHSSLSQIDGPPIAIFHSFLHFNDCSASKATLTPFLQFVFIKLWIFNPFSNPKDHCMQWLFWAQHLPISFCCCQGLSVSIHLHFAPAEYVTSSQLSSSKNKTNVSNCAKNGLSLEKPRD